MKFYRYDADYGFTLDVKLRTYKLLRETPKGYWIIPDYYYGTAWKKWILKVSRKRYAYPSKKEALESFIIRKQRQIVHCDRDLRNAKMLLSIAKEMKS